MHRVGLSTTRAVALAAAILVLAGCVPEPSDPPAASDPPATVEPSEPTTAAPEPSEPVAVPTAWAGGDCSAILSADTAPAELGAVEGAPHRTVQVPIATLGGLSCSFMGDNWLHVLIFPEGQVTPEIADRYTETVCESFGYDGYGCRVARTSGGAWTLTTLVEGSGGVPVEPGPLLDATADAVAANAAAASPGVAADRTEQWWPDRSCTSIGEAIDIAGMLGIDEYDFGYPADGGSDVSTEIVLAAGTSLGYCAWYGWAEGNELRAIQFWPSPGGGWAWGDIAAEITETETLTVDGATATRAGVDVNDEPRVQLTDGVNLLTARVDELAGDPSAALAEILAALVA